MCATVVEKGSGDIDYSYDWNAKSLYKSTGVKYTADCPVTATLTPATGNAYATLSEDSLNG